MTMQNSSDLTMITSSMTVKLLPNKVLLQGLLLKLGNHNSPGEGDISTVNINVYKYFQKSKSQKLESNTQATFKIKNTDFLITKKNSKMLAEQINKVEKQQF